MKKIIRIIAITVLLAISVVIVVNAQRTNFLPTPAGIFLAFIPMMTGIVCAATATSH